LISAVPRCTDSAALIALGSGLSIAQGVSVTCRTVSTSHFRYRGSLPTKMPAFTSM
jgi:hypothetical protein